MNEQVKKVLSENFWDLATCVNNEVNVVTVAHKMVMEDGTLTMGAVFMDKTLENIKLNNKVAIAVFAKDHIEGYQIKGTAKYITEGPLVDKYKAIVEGHTNAMETAKGVVIVTIDKIYVTTPGANNNKELM